MVLQHPGLRLLSPRAKLPHSFLACLLPETLTFGVPPERMSWLRIEKQVLLWKQAAYFVY